MAPGADPYIYRRTCLPARTFVGACPVGAWLCTGRTGYRGVRNASAFLVDLYGRSQVFQRAADGLEDGDGLVVGTAGALAAAELFEGGADVAGGKPAGGKGIEQVAGFEGSFVGIDIDLGVEEAFGGRLRSWWA